MANECVIRIVCDGFGRRGAHAGQFVSFFNPNSYLGRGRIITVADPRQALVFAGPFEAMTYYRQQSSTHPLRDDEMPNRPLTAYTVEFLCPADALAVFEHEQRRRA